MKTQFIITGNILKFFLLVLLSVLMSDKTTAQKAGKKISISGSVIDARLYPVANAIIMIDGQKTDVMTDHDGKYRIRVSSDARKIGTVSFGDGLIEQEINGRARINFIYSSREERMNPAGLQDLSLGEEAVNTGYGHTKKKYLTNSVKRINARERRYASYKSIKEMLEREASGVRIIGEDIIIRGSSNLYGWVPALLMVDGVPVDDLEGISPRVVESIEVLKDASASIYGTRGYGGAVLITTRK